MRTFLSLPDTREDTTVALDSSEEVDERESGDGEDDIEKLWDVRNLRCSSERGPLTLKFVKSHCKTLSLPMPNTFIKAQQKIEDAIRALLTTHNCRFR